MIRAGVSKSPDNKVGVPFSISAVDPAHITINLNSGNQLQITTHTFSTAMFYLIRNDHNINHPINLESNDTPNLSGPLCLATRLANNNIRCINYIAPILAHFQFIGVSGARLNSCWYL